MSNRKYRCIYCGDWFELNDEDNQFMEEGFITHEPDCCDDCNPNPQYEEETFSDADPGL